MTRTHEQILADLEQDARGAGVPTADIDRYIADQLKIPLDYYFAYLLVWGAIEAHRAGNNHTHSLAGADPSGGGGVR